MTGNARWERHEPSANPMVPKALRAHVMFLIIRKIPDRVKRHEALIWAKNPIRSESHLQNFAKRLEAMPDRERGDEAGR